MKKYLFIIAAAATCLLVACSKEKELRAPETNTEETTASEFVRLPGWTYVGASNLEDSKASITNDATPVFKWNAGDKIALFTDNNDYLVSAGLDNSFDNATEAEFAFEGTGIDDHRAFFAVYPASLVSGCANPTANSLAINLPASYTLAQVQGEVSPIPMVAANAPGDPLAFKSICALLRITVKNVAWDAKSIKIRFPGQKVNGSFELTSFVPGEGGVAGAASSSEAEETITITDLNLNDTYAEQLVVNIPVPMGTFNYVVTGAYDASGLVINWINTPVKVSGSTGEPLAWSPGRKSRRTLTADLPVFTAWGSKENYGYIAKADRRMIVFAPGNLQAQLDVCPTKTDSWDSKNFTNLGSASAWRFAEHQYDAIANSKPENREDAEGVTWSYNSMENPRSGDWVDLFSWIGNDGAIATTTKVDASKKWGIAYHISSGTSGSYGNTKTGTASLLNEWGSLQIMKYGENRSYNSNAWHTPSKDEFSYVLNRRYTGSSDYNGIPCSAVRAKLTISGGKSVCGIIIFPDNFVLPYCSPAISIYLPHPGASTQWKLQDTNVNNAKCSENTYTLAQWEKLEGAGCVFLPFTSTTQFSSALTILTDYVAEGCYWSSTPSSTNMAPFSLAFNDIEEEAGHRRYSNSVTNLSATYDSSGMNRAYGCGVRLTRWVKPE